MVKKPARRRALLPTAELAELQDDIFAVLIHELGGQSSALALRADVLGAGLSPADLLALRTLAEQGRDMSRLLRLLRGPLGDGLLAPARELAVADWWRLVTPLVSHALPRGMRLLPSFEISTVPPSSATTLTYLILVALRALGTASTSVRGDFSVTLRESPDGALHCDLLMTVASAWHGSTPSPSRWHRYCARLARRERVILTWWSNDEAVWRWSCTFAPSTVPTSPPHSEHPPIIA